MSRLWQVLERIQVNTIMKRSRDLILLKIRLKLKFIRKLQCARCTMARLNDNTSTMTKLAYNTYNYS